VPADASRAGDSNDTTEPAGGCSAEGRSGERGRRLQPALHVCLRSFCWHVSLSLNNRPPAIIPLLLPPTHTPCACCDTYHTIRHACTPDCLQELASLRQQLQAQTAAHEQLRLHSSQAGTVDVEAVVAQVRRENQTDLENIREQLREVGWAVGGGGGFDGLHACIISLLAFAQLCGGVSWGGG